MERVSLVEQVLQRDPSGVYGRMDFLSRDRYRQAVEAARCLEEGVVTDARDADVGAILGWGFAPWLGS